VKRLIIALDYSDAASALALATRLDPQHCRMKVGKELFTAGGPALVEELTGRGFEIFLDLKFHDIPNTVAQASKAAAKLGVWMFNVHASGGRSMMRAAREAVEGMRSRPHLIAVTVLTSMDASDLREIGIGVEPQVQVERLAGLAHDCGLDGVVCSAFEATALRTLYGENFLRVTPGIRLDADSADDQKRVMTPALAMKSGASYLVVGRPVTRADDPAAVVMQINQQISEFTT
jgi:orotidine-5'-phosphate decarboxylase